MQSYPLINEIDRMQHELALRNASHTDVAQDEDIVHPILEEIAQNWQSVSYSDLPDHTLHRYFQSQLRSLLLYDDEQYILGYDRTGIPTLLIGGLTRLLLEHYEKYLDKKSLLPSAFRMIFIFENKPVITGHLEELSEEGLSPGLVDVVKIFYYDVFERQNSLDILTLELIRRLSTVLINFGREGDDAEEHFVNVLLANGFNHIGLFLWMTENFGKSLNELPFEEREDFLTKLLKQYSLRIPSTKLFYGKYQPIETMLCGWIREELDTIAECKKETASLVQQYGKLKFDLSVPYLACIMRLFHDEGLIPVAPASLFRLVTAHFSTKKQDMISAQSFGKEFYATSQVTAAKVQGLLKNMVSALNRKYFP